MRYINLRFTYLLYLSWGGLICIVVADILITGLWHWHGLSFKNFCIKISLFSPVFVWP